MLEMSRHEGVSCDSCLKGNFCGRRYKCLTCYDYDLCASCYEAGATTTRHTVEHPMQCILTRSDFELYYKGEGLTTEQSQSFTCPLCGRMGFTETALQEHVNADHPDSTVEVVCPICATQPRGDPNLVTEDFAGHLALEHRPTPRDLISFLDEPTGTRHSVRRLPHSTRGIGNSRPRRSNMHFSSSGGISSLSPSGRDAVDPIAELLSQLSGVRRNNPTQGSASAQLQQLQMQLQMERQQVRVARQQLERLPRRQVHATTATTMTTGTTSAAVSSISNHVLTVSNASGGTATPKTSETSGNNNTSAHVQPHSQLMLTKCMDTNLTETELEALEVERADRSIFLQDLLLNTLMISADDEKTPTSVATTATVANVESKHASSSSLSRASPPQMPSQSSPQQPTIPQTSATAIIVERSKSDTSSSNNANNGINVEAPPYVAKRSISSSQQRTSPGVERTPTTNTSQQRTMAPQPQSRSSSGSGSGNGSSIEYVLSPRPQQPTTDSTISVRGVLMGSSYSSADTARRKPICTVESINQATEPPTSH